MPILTTIAPSHLATVAPPPISSPRTGATRPPAAQTIRFSRHQFASMAVLPVSAPMASSVAAQSRVIQLQDSSKKKKKQQTQAASAATAKGDKNSTAGKKRKAVESEEDDEEAVAEAAPAPGRRNSSRVKKAAAAPSEEEVSSDEEPQATTRRSRKLPKASASAPPSAASSAPPRLTRNHAASAAAPSPQSNSDSDSEDNASDEAMGFSDDESEEDTDIPALKKTWTHGEGFDQGLEYGQGLKHHEFTNLQFSDPKSFDKYKKKTGSEEIDARSAQGNKFTTSRRGSVSNHVVNPDGSIDVFRLSSWPTTQAGKASKADEVGAYEGAAKSLNQKATNGANNKVTSNYVYSDMTEVHHKPGKGFITENESHATAASAKALDAKTDMETKRATYLSDAFDQDLGNPTPTSHFHSERMSTHFHNLAMGGNHQRNALNGLKRPIVMVASKANSVCGNCAAGYGAALPDHSLVSSSSGRQFMHFSEGVETHEKTTIARATPADELVSDDMNATNQAEYRAVLEYRRRARSAQKARRR